MENSLSGLLAAFKLDVDAVEFDVHRTSDGVIVVMHDHTTRRTATENVAIQDTTFQRLQEIVLRDGQPIPTLEQVLQHAGKQTIYIDIKAKGCAEPLLRLTQRFPKLHIVYASFHQSELLRIRELAPDAETFLYIRKEDTYFLPRPIKMIKTALSIGATGIAIDKLYLNPGIYKLAKQVGLQMYTYSINSGRTAQLVSRLYPGVDIATKHPKAINRHLQK